MGKHKSERVERGPGPLKFAAPLADGYTVGAWCPTRDGSGPAEAVVLEIPVMGIGKVGLRVKSRRAMDELVQLLGEYADQVWPAAIRKGP